ncbi:MAG TPA: ArsI/CadI family heavy metal resistance metalloenzyme [Pyrinomonadaceae bacterium]
MEKEEANRVNVLKAHLALNVRNVTESIEFYRKMLGIEPSKVRTGYAKFNVENPPLNLTLNQVAFRERGALSHMGLQVASTQDVLAMRERWQQSGLLTRDEMQTNCCYAIQDKTWVHDPDGNEWEVFVVLEDNLAETGACCTAAVTGQQEAATASSCSTENAPGAVASSNCCAPAAIEPVALTR